VVTQSVSVCQTCNSFNLFKINRSRGRRSTTPSLGPPVPVSKWVTAVSLPRYGRVVG
jgi:hypothetical protein